MELWFEATLCEESMAALVGGKHLGTLVVLQWFHMDVVAVMVIQEKHAFVACAGGQDEAASGV